MPWFLKTVKWQNKKKFPLPGKSVLAMAPLMLMDVGRVSLLLHLFYIVWDTEWVRQEVVWIGCKGNEVMLLVGFVWSVTTNHGRSHVFHARQPTKHVVVELISVGGAVLVEKVHWGGHSWHDRNSCAQVNVFAWNHEHIICSFGAVCTAGTAQRELKVHTWFGRGQRRLRRWGVCRVVRRFGGVRAAFGQAERLVACDMWLHARLEVSRWFAFDEVVHVDIGCVVMKGCVVVCHHWVHWIILHYCRDWRLVEFVIPVVW